MHLVMNRTGLCSGKTKSCFTGSALLLALFLVLCAVPCKTALATEGGGGAYPNGAEDFMTGSVPPPGTYFINYFSYYHAGKLKDNSGRSMAVDFDLESWANTFRLVHITKHKLFGANWGMHVLVPFIDMHLKTPRGKGSKSGMGDITLNPLLLSWHFTNWHLAAGVDTKVPTGSYNSRDIANTGRNYWTVEPIVAFSYLSKDGYEVSSKIMYDFNTKNDDTHYTSGQEFHVDYTVGRKFGNLSAGLGGYYYKQITDDRLRGDRVEGKKGQVFAVGPQFRYGYKNMYFTFKYQWETLVKNRAEGDKLWFKFGYAF